eukprot:3766316-Alexandrium_andersonii.AAC.1
MSDKRQGGNVQTRVCNTTACGTHAAWWAAVQRYVNVTAARRPQLAVTRQQRSQLAVRHH